MAASLICLIFAGLISSAAFGLSAVILMTFAIIAEGLVLYAFGGVTGEAAILFAIAGACLYQTAYGIGLAFSARFPILADQN